MNSTSENILQAVDILVDQKLSELKYDKTVKAEIYDIVNLDIGEYKIKLSGAIVLAYATDGTSYKIGDEVYVTIPEGDYSNKKIINSKVTTSSLSEGQLVTLQNAIKETSPTFETMYSYLPFQEYGVVAGAPIDSPVGEAVIFQGEYDGYHDMFRQYSRQNDKIRIQASFLVQFYNTHTQGNYGLEVSFYTKNEATNDDIPGEATFRLDLPSFNGRPYEFSTYSPQSIVLQYQQGYLLGLKGIRLFQEDFEYDRYMDGGEVTDRQNTTIPNIFVKNIAIQFVEELDLTDNLYYLDISFPRGNALDSRTPYVDLVGKLIYQGENVMKSSNCVCTWYKHDASIMIGREEYNHDAGAGWTAISTPVYNTLTLDATMVPYDQEFKLVCIYKETVVMSKTVTVYNLNTEYDFALAQVTEQDKIYLQIENYATDDILIGDWFVSYPDASYTSVQQRKNKIEITPYLIYSTVVFHCSVYDVDGIDIVGYLERTVSASGEEQDVEISYTGEQIYRYDANGDITIEDSEKERTLQIALRWKDGTGTSYKIEWLSPDGQKLTNTRMTDITNSMLDNLWVDEFNILHYTIRQKYRINYAANVLTVRITTVDGRVYDFLKEILFIKDGDQGTNGTTYVAAIRPYDLDTGLKLAGLNPLIYRNSEWIGVLPLKCFVYKDGEPIREDECSVTYKWIVYNITPIEPGGTVETQRDGGKYWTGGQVFKAQGTSAIVNNAASPYVKVQVDINDKIENGRTSIYALYPIDVAINMDDSQLAAVDISNIPSYIKYNSSGTNPQYYNNNINFYYNKEDLTANVSSLHENILGVRQRETGYYLRPASNFIFEDNTIAMLDCKYNNTYHLYHPIIMFLDPYGNEAVNGWDGTSVEIGNGHILAPQIGAGEKDSYNRFTGVVMGKDSGQGKIGLYGYQYGVSSFGLMENGEAYFGKHSSGGRIVIDGDTGQIYGGDGGGSASGMTINLANKSTSGNTKAIIVGSNVFTVDYNGNVVANSAVVKGDITANTGYIGGVNGWVIEPYRIYSKNSGSKRVELNSNSSNDYAIWAGRESGADAATSTFAITKTGDIYARKGFIGSWILTDDYLVSDETRKQTGISPLGKTTNGLVFWAGNSSPYGYVNENTTAFSVTSSGIINCTMGKIGAWTIDQGAIYVGDTRLNEDGSFICKSGQIGGWKIQEHVLQSSNGKMQLDSTGIIKGGILMSNNSSGIINLVGALESGPVRFGSVVSSLNPDGSENVTAWGFDYTNGGSIRVSGSHAGISFNTNNYISVIDGAIGVSSTGLTQVKGEGLELIATSGIIVKAAGITFDIPANMQFNIYARFA